MARGLLATGDAFLLEHNERRGRDNTWSNNADGEGQNWLGLILMLVRDALHDGDKPGSWTAFVHEECGVDLARGPDRLKGNPRWQAVVRQATAHLRQQLAKL